MRRRIALIDYFPPHYRRGVYEAIARRMETDFYFFSDERERWQNKAIAAVREGDYRAVELRRLRVAGQAIMPGLVPAISPKRYDAVIKGLNGKVMFPLVYLTAKARGVPYVLWTGMWYHPTTRAHQISKRPTEAVYRNCASIVTYGTHVKRFVEETPGVDPAKVYVAGQAVDPSRFVTIERPETTGPDALFIGQFKDYKGVMTLLDAWEQLNGAAGRLRLIGNGPLEDQIRARVQGRDDVEIVGHVKQDRLPAELQRARFLVLPSETTELDREPWGLVVNEAMHAGLPVVASDAVGAAAGGLVREGRNGYVVPERSPEQLAAAMRRMLENPDEAAKLGRQAREDVKAFNYERMADAFEAAIEHAVTGQPQTPPPSH